MSQNNVNVELQQQFILNQPIDSELSESSSDPVENKAVAKAIREVREDASQATKSAIAKAESENLAEASRAKAEESMLNKKIDDEIARATSSENSISSRLEDESSRAKSAEKEVADKVANGTTVAKKAETASYDELRIEPSHYFTDVALNFDAATGKVTVTMTTQSGKSVSKTADLPTEMIVSSGRYIPTGTGDGPCIELVLANGSIIHIPVGDLVDEIHGGATSEITLSYNKSNNTMTGSINDDSVAMEKLTPEVREYVKGKGLMNASVEYEETADPTYGIKLPYLAVRYFSGISVTSTTDPTYGVELQTLHFNF